MNFHSINKDNYSMLKLFLANVPSIKEVDEEVLNNAIIAVEENKVVGCISYEAYESKGLIRYFIFKSIPQSSIFIDLFENLENKASSNGVKEIIGVAQDDQTKELFESLGFNPITGKTVFIDETNAQETQFKSAIFMSKFIC